MNRGDKMDNELLVKSIKKLCKNNNISISQLENALNFSPSLISRWKDKNPNIDRIIDIADYFQISIDEVVGRKISDNIFINKLIENTQKKSIKWNAYNNSDSDPKFYYYQKSGLFSESEVFYHTLHFHETSYYSPFENGYISIYGQYDDDKIANPNDIKLFIQPTKDSQLVEQKFSNKDLYSLWIKVIYSVGACSSDEIKAEKFKNDFINTPENLTNEKIDEFLENPSLMKLFETVSTEEFRKVQQIFENPEFKSALKTINSMQNYLANKK